MKNNNSNKIFISIIFILFTINSIAGTETGGGGDVVVLPNDSVVLADPFIDLNAEQPNNMPPVRSLNPRIIKTIESYYKASQYIVAFLAGKDNSEINQEIEKLTRRRNDLRFYGVRSEKELNQFCAPGGSKKYSLPTGAKVEQVACTAGTETFIVEPTFIRLSIRDQALLLIHERLTTLRDAQGGKNYSAIARFTTGLNVYLNLYTEQSKNIFRKLSQDEQKWLTEFYKATEELELRNLEINPDSFQWLASPNGGGLIHADARVDASALIGLKFIVYKDSEILANAQLKRGKMAQPSYLGESIIGENSVIDQSVLEGTIRLAKNVIILNSEVKGLTAGENSIIESSQIYSPVSSGDNLRIKKSKISVFLPSEIHNCSGRVCDKRAPQISLSADQTLENGLIDSSSFETYPNGMLVAPMSVSWEVPFSYNEFKYDHIDTSSFREFKLLDKGGVKIDVTTDAKAVRRGIFDSSQDIIVTKVRFNLSVTQTNSLNNNSYTVFEGKIYPAGQNKYVHLVPNRNFEKAMMTLIEPKLISLGFELTEIPYKDGWKVLIPLK